jgi:FAD/FMN-containing dehydrogenase
MSGKSEHAGVLDAIYAAAIAAETTKDVVAAVNFARKNNLRVVVKGGAVEA